MTGRSIILFFAFAVLFAGCRKETPPVPEPKNAPASAAATAAPRDLRNSNMDVVIPLLKNAVAKCAPEKNEFAPNEPIRLTLDLNESPEGLRVGARIVDDDGQEVTYANVPANGQKHITMTIDAPKAGTYTLEGYWGGNRVCEETITVE